MSIQLADLHNDLHELREILRGDDYALAQAMVTDHARRLQAYLQQDDADRSREALKPLLALQQAVTAQMRMERDHAAAWLRSSRQSSHAARLYSQAGLLG
ncbi:MULTISPECIES: hypothetical protein [Xanthomonas]|uniref:Flagellar protein FliT n=1 Tax=Xanthomonas indica TaxID=2912242 RepID=A0AAU8I1U0_9XANT|nr:MULTISPECIES: hypothetical protein [Xanthomonas]MBB6365990.1 hypothetical protein [Xanthomonas sp. F10]MXV33428.1 hypothetical protein [Xanthomonas sp. LMG 8989]MCI2246317.1 hypothetical protein [Xanthomonas indica]MCI2260696.1 hypothetical protein [Xanthomonas indica]UYC10252.1 hypothetical protein NUG21_10545 [Xanthomonas sp. CFBP 8445]